MAEQTQGKLLQVVGPSGRTLLSISDDHHVWVYDNLTLEEARVALCCLARSLEDALQGRPLAVKRYV